MKFAPDWMLPGGSRTAYDALISATAGKGPQSNKWGYVNVIQWGTVCASVQSFAGGLGFAFKQAGDAASWGVYWGANLGLWSALFTAVATVAVKKANATKEIVIAGMPAGPTPPPAPVSKLTTTDSKTTVEEPAP